MKKNFLITALLSLFILFSGCRKSALLGTENCLENIEKINTTLQNYLENPTAKNCKNYVEALRSYLKSERCFGNIFFAEYQKTFKELEADECK
jgi:hypothetical protein